MIGPPGISGVVQEIIAWFGAVVIATFCGIVGMAVLAVTAMLAEETRVPTPETVGVTIAVELSPPITRVTVSNPVELITDVPPALTVDAQVIGKPFQEVM